VNFGIESIDLANVNFTPELLRCIPAATARTFRVLPIFSGPSGLIVALADAKNLEVIDSLFQTLHRALEFRVAERHQLDDFIQRHYGDEDR